jgi:hypothetical protein
LRHEATGLTLRGGAPGADGSAVDDLREAPLGPGERRLVAALETGASADFTGAPAEECRIRAPFLRAALWGLPLWPGGPKPAIRGLLRVRGAHIVGPLRAPLGDTEAIERRVSLLFSGCTFDAPIDVSGADLLSLQLLDCTLPALIGANLRVTTDVDLSGSRLSGTASLVSDLADVEACALHLSAAEIGGRLALAGRAKMRFSAHGTVRLESARIEGDLVLDGAQLDGAGMAALDARASTIGGDVRLGMHGDLAFEARGEVSLSAATVTGDVLAFGARLVNPEGRALHCEDMQAESVLLGAAGDRAFVAHGRLNFLSATIGGNLSIANARLAPGPDYNGRFARGGGVCLNMRQMRVSNALLLGDVGALDPGDAAPRASVPAPPIAGWFMLSAAQLTTISADETGWPAPGFLELDGATYARVYDGVHPADAARRIRWLLLQYPGGIPTAERFRPQPFEELARVLRNHGRVEEADAVAVEKIRIRLRAKVDTRWGRVLPRLLLVSSLHGHSSGRALLSFTIYIALGMLLYGTALYGFDQPFVPTESDPTPAQYTSLFGLLETTHARGCSALQLPLYPLDLALPLVDMGQSSTCRFDPQGGARWLWGLLHSAYAIGGAALSAVVVLTLSGILRRD